MEDTPKVFTVRVDSTGKDSNVEFSVPLLPTVTLKNISQVEVLSASVALDPVPTANSINIYIAELRNLQNIGISGEYQNYGSIVAWPINTDYNRTTFEKNSKWDQTINFLKPLDSVTDLTIRILDDTNIRLPDNGTTFLTLRFTCQPPARLAQPSSPPPPVQAPPPPTPTPTVVQATTPNITIDYQRIDYRYYIIALLALFGLARLLLSARMR
jgi:hypothetical protein